MTGKRPLPSGRETSGGSPPPPLSPVDIGSEPDPVARPDHDVALDAHRHGRAIHSIALPCPHRAFPLNPRAVPRWFRARSSAGEHYVDIVGVTGSIPVAPTILSNMLDPLSPRRV